MERVPILVLIGAVAEKPVVIDGKIEIRMLPITATTIIATSTAGTWPRDADVQELPPSRRPRSGDGRGPSHQRARRRTAIMTAPST